MPSTPYLVVLVEEFVYILDKKFTKQNDIFFLKCLKCFVHRLLTSASLHVV